MSKLIDLEELDSELDRTRTKFDSWAKYRVRVAADCKSNHACNLQEATAKISGLENRFQVLKGAAEKVRVRLQHENSEVATLTDILTSLQTERDTLHKSLQSINKTISHEMSQLNSREEQFQQSMASKKKKLNALDQALEFYDSRLGLEFRQGEDELQLLMTQVRSRPLMICDHFCFAAVPIWYS